MSTRTRSFLLTFFSAGDCDSPTPVARRTAHRLTRRAHCCRNAPGESETEPVWKGLLKLWSDPKADSLARLETPALESTFEARYQFGCAAIGVSAPAPRAPPCRQGRNQRLTTHYDVLILSATSYLSMRTSVFPEVRPVKIFGFRLLYILLTHQTYATRRSDH